MLQISRLQLILCILLPILIESKDTWTYENKNQWQEKHHYCDGNLQSPIDIHLNQSAYNPHLKRMYFEKVLLPTTKLSLMNNGYTAQLNMSGHYRLKHVIPHGEDYIVEQLHVHWSHAGDDHYGSEHLLDGKSYPFELHVVAYSSLYSNIAEAMTNVRGLAVVGLFFQISNESNEFLEPIVSACRHVHPRNTYVDLTDDFKLISLMGESGIPRYFRYDGSLTTPPCYESVVWSVIPEPQYISREQLNSFQKLHDTKNQIMKDIYRLPFDLGTRKLYRTFRSSHPEYEKAFEPNSVTSTYHYKTLFFIFVGLFYFL